MNLKCHFDSSGWLQGPIRITHLFTPNHGTGFGTGRGVCMHTEAGYEAGTVATFMNRANGVSAFFSIAQSGACTQYLPVGKGYSAWSQVSGNDTFRGIEDEDRTHPSIPLTSAQLTTFAQIFEACSAYDGFPLQITDSPSGKGLILHSDGGSAWGGHFSCPGSVRAAQRPAIVALAKKIRSGGAPTPAAVKTWKSAGQLTLHDLCAQHLHEQVSTVLRVTALNSPGRVFAANAANHVTAVFGGDAARCPSGVTWYYPHDHGAQPWVSRGMLSLSALASKLGTTPAVMLQLTAQHSGAFPAANAAYINAVFGRTPIKVPAGCVLHY